MQPPKSSNDDVTGRRLRLLVGLVVVLALGCAGAWVWLALHQPQAVPPWWVPVALIAGFVVANRIKVYVRLRSNLDIVYWGEAPILVGLVLLPAPWVVLCAAVGMAATKIFTGTSAQKTLFAVGKEVLTVSTAGAVLLAWGMSPSLRDPPFNLVAIVTAYFVLTVVDYLAYWPVMATASGTTAWRFPTFH